MWSRLLGVSLLVTAPAAFAAESPPEPVLVVHNHHYEPERLEVPAGVKFVLVVKNQDDTPEEFESADLDREKLVAPGGETKVYLGPLDPGTYAFTGDFHQDTARGVIVAK